MAEYPSYRLRSSYEGKELPTGKYARAAMLALREGEGPIPLPALAKYYCSHFRSAARCPEFWMWSVLQTDLSRVVAKSGELCIGLLDPERRQQVQGSVSERKAPSTTHTQEPIGRRIDEKSLETMLANRPDLLESGLTLFQRQCRIPVGIIDLLFVDRERNYVVVEIKRPAADYREVVGQITTYMGWVRKNIAGPSQTVRGIIVVGKPNERLSYSIDQVSGVAVRSFF